MRPTIVWLSLAALALSPAASVAQEAPTSANPDAATGAPVSDGGAPPDLAPAKAAANSNAMSFDFFNEPKKPSAIDQARLAQLERKVKLRRRLLTWHQALGFVTLAALAVTDIIGTLDYHDKYSAGGSDNGQLLPWHEGLSIGTTGLFAATGILALAAPNPYPKPRKFDATLIHKIAMAIACVGFVAEIALGPLTAVSDGKLFQRDLAVTHVAVGWATFGFMGAGVLSYVF